MLLVRRCKSPVLKYLIFLWAYVLVCLVPAYSDERVTITYSNNRYVCVVSSSNTIEARRSGKTLQTNKLIRKIRRSIKKLNSSASTSFTRIEARERTISLLIEIKNCIAGSGRYGLNQDNDAESEGSSSSQGNSSSSDSVRPGRLVPSDLALNIEGSRDEQTLTLTNAGDTAVSFQLSSSDAWVSITPADGTISRQPLSIRILVDKTNLFLGSTSSSLRLTGSDGTDLRVSIAVMKSGVPAPRAQVLAWLRELAPLPKRHFTWKPWESLYADDNEDLLYEMIRLNNGISVADWPNAAHIDKVVRLCKQINSTNPTIPASIAFVDSPFTAIWPAGAPPTYNGPERAQELSRHADQLATLANYIATANARYAGPNIQISYIAYDLELWRLKLPGESGYQIWNDAMRANYDAIYDITKSYFPNAPIDWYSRGWIRFFGNHEPPAWADLPYYHFDLSEQGDTCSAVMYRLPMQSSSREVFTRTVDYCAGFGISRVIPWIALGAGYRPTDDNTNVYYSPDWNYSLQVSWNFGHQINDPGDAAWAPAEWVMIYPSPFQEESPYFAQHYIAYVRGAQGITALPQ